MSKRVSHSILDPYIAPLVPKLYDRLSIPVSFPPEGIVIIGHLTAALGAFGFAYSSTYAWAALLISIGAAGNHLADMVDGTHARRTGQCRNGGELLDHFFDPLSFSYWMIGLAVSCQRLDLGFVAVLCIYATAVLTNIKAKMIGQFTLSRFGPTEFKALLVLYGLLLFLIHTGLLSVPFGEGIHDLAELFLWILVVVGVVQLIRNLWRGVIEVNNSDAKVDEAEWDFRGK